MSNDAELARGFEDGNPKKSLGSKKERKGEGLQHLEESRKLEGVVHIQEPLSSPVLVRRWWEKGGGVKLRIVEAEKGQKGKVCPKGDTGGSEAKTETSRPGWR